MICRLCGTSSCSLFCHDLQRTFLRCSHCDLIFVPEEQCPSHEKQLERYALHHNTCDDAGYVSYLRDVIADLDRIPIRNPGILDFGSGPEQVLTKILREQGIQVTAYDPLYGITGTLQSHSFDIVILCEVIEHLSDFTSEIALLQRVLKPEGYYLIHTALVPEVEKFTEWWYTRDVTHISFFTLRTMEYLADRVEKKICYTDRKNVVILG